ncbi:sigma-54-dependent transcriptional regulator [Marinilabilia sp.]
MQKVLVVDDDTSFGMMVKGYLKKNNFEVTLAGSFSKAKELIEKKLYDLVLSDYRLPDGTGMDVLQYSKKQASFVPVILITAYSDIRVAVNAIKNGAFEYVTKPVNAEELLHVVKKAVLKRKSFQKDKSEYLKGNGKESLKMEEHIQLVAPTEVAVLIQGESGTGKEYVARRIHELSTHKDEPFVAVDCGALTTEIASSELFGHVKGSFTGAVDDKVGHFENVGKGTIFLDEVGNLSYEVQVKLLRAIQERKAHRLGGSKEFSIEARIVAASNEDLRRSSEVGNFREDLYHRLNEFKISLPPLRERQDELMKFANHFLELSANEFQKPVEGYSSQVLNVFRNYDWPGNLRELRNVVRRSVLLSKGNLVEVENIPPELVEKSKEASSSSIILSDVRDEAERILIQETLEKARHNKTKAAQMLGMDRKTLYNKLQKYGIEY